MKHFLRGAPVSFFSSPSFKLVVRFVVVALQAARVFIENRSRREPGDEGKCSRYQLALAAGIRERADDGDTTSRRRAASQCPKDIKRKRETPSTRNLKGKRKKKKKKRLTFQGQRDFSKVNRFPLLRMAAYELLRRSSPVRSVSWLLL